MVQNQSAQNPKYAKMTLVIVPKLSSQVNCEDVWRRTEWLLYKPRCCLMLARSFSLQYFAAVFFSSKFSKFRNIYYFLPNPGCGTDTRCYPWSRWRERLTKSFAKEDILVMMRKYFKWYFDESFPFIKRYFSSKRSSSFAPRGYQREIFNKRYWQSMIAANKKVK